MKPVKIGNPPWTRLELKNSLEEFSNIYKERPIKDNQGGMKSVHLFYIWFLLKKLQPTYVIESGVLHGQGTWVIDQVLPKVHILCLDPRQPLSKIIYKSKNAEYIQKDFLQIRWNSEIPKDTVLIFDDHQNAYLRVQHAIFCNFKYLIFEDNYAKIWGDCLSIKKILEEDYNPRLVNYLLTYINTYAEFPPIFYHNRFNKGRKDIQIRMHDPLYNYVEKPYLQTYYNEHNNYNFMCYIRLK